MLRVASEEAAAQKRAEADAARRRAQADAEMRKRAEEALARQRREDQIQKQKAEEARKLNDEARRARDAQRAKDHADQLRRLESARALMGEEPQPFERMSAAFSSRQDEEVKRRQALERTAAKREAEEAAATARLTVAAHRAEAQKAAAQKAAAEKEATARKAAADRVAVERVATEKAAVEREAQRRAPAVLASKQSRPRPTDAAATERPSKHPKAGSGRVGPTRAQGSQRDRDSSDDEAGEAAPSPKRSKAERHAPPQSGSSLPPGWSEQRHHATAKDYSTYHGPSGEKARSLPDAWRKHEAAKQVAQWADVGWASAAHVRTSTSAQPSAQPSSTRTEAAGETAAGLRKSASVRAAAADNGGHATSTEAAERTVGAATSARGGVRRGAWQLDDSSDDSSEEEEEEDASSGEPAAPQLVEKRTITSARHPPAVTLSQDEAEAIVTRCEELKAQADVSGSGVVHTFPDASPQRGWRIEVTARRAPDRADGRKSWRIDMAVCDGKTVYRSFVQLRARLGLSADTTARGKPSKATTSTAHVSCAARQAAAAEAAPAAAEAAPAAAEAAPPPAEAASAAAATGGDAGSQSDAVGIAAGPAAAQSNGEAKPEEAALVGQRVRIWWQEDRKWYSGKVVSWHGGQVNAYVDDADSDYEGWYKVRYDDGDVDWEDLDNMRWNLI